MRATIARRGLLGGLSVAAASAVRPGWAQSPSVDSATFTEFSPQPQKMVPGRNRRIFTDTDSRRGNSIACDFTTGVVSLAPGYYHLSGFSMVGYDSSKEPPEMTATRSPAAAGYCRLRRVTANAAPEPLDLRTIDNADPSVLSIGSTSSANLVPSLFETFYDTTAPAQLVLEHQSGSNPQDILLRVFVGNSKWHAFARISIRRLQ